MGDLQAPKMEVRSYYAFPMFLAIFCGDIPVQATIKHVSSSGMLTGSHISCFAHKFSLQIALLLGQH